MGPVRGRERAADPDGAFVEVGKKLGADDAAEDEEAGEEQRQSRKTDGEEAMFDGPLDGVAIAAGEPGHHRVLPLAGALGEEQARQHRGKQEGEDQRAEQREADRPRHGLEEAAFDRLQREDGQVRGDDHGAREEDRALHFVRGLANLLCRSDALLAAMAEVADDVLHHHHGAVHDHAEVQRAEREQVCGNIAQIQADCGEEQRKRNGEGDDDRAAHIAEKEEQDDDDEDDAFGEVVQHRVGRVVEQLAAIEERDDLDAGGRTRLLSSSTFS